MTPIDENTPEDAMTSCCGQPRATRFCPECGKDLGEAELLIVVDVPPDVSDEELIAAVGEISLMADQVHRSVGGKGLQVDRVEIFPSEPRS